MRRPVSTGPKWKVAPIRAERVSEIAGAVLDVRELLDAPEPDVWEPL